MKKKVNEEEIPLGDPFKVPKRNIEFSLEEDNELVNKAIGNAKNAEQLYSLFPERKILPLAIAAKYLGISKSHLYKLTSTNRISFYRPMGKLIYIHIDQLDEFLMQNKINSSKEINEMVSNLKLNSKGKNL